MKYCLIIFLAIISIVFASAIFDGCGKTISTPTNGESHFQFVMGSALYQIPPIALPAKSSSISDPNFHTSITRLTDKTIDGYSDPGIENEYARSDPENCDGTHFILRGHDGNWYLFNSATNQMIKNLTSSIGGGGEEPEPRWDASNPKIFYYLYGTELRNYNIAADTSTTIHDFKVDFPLAAYITTKTEGDASLDRRYWSFMIENSIGDVISVATYDKNTNSVIGQKNTFIDAINWVSMDMSGKHCVIGYDSATAEVFSRDLSSSKYLPDLANGHMDLAQTLDGKDVMVYQNNHTDWIAMADLDTATEIPLVKIPFFDSGTRTGNNDIGLHFSGNCGQTPGWVLVSTYGSKNPPPGQDHTWMDTQLFMVELKANPRIWRIAHTHSYTSLDFIGDKNYFAEAFAAINTKGTKIYFGSNWDVFVADPINNPYSDAYRITLPSNWSSNTP